MVLPSGEDTGWEREGKRRTAGLERDNRRKRERGSIESPLQRVSAGVARWNHAAARGLFSVYICRSITLDPVGCRPLSRRVRCSGAQPAARGMNLVRPFLSLSLSLPPFLSVSVSVSLTLCLCLCRPAFWSCQNLRGIRTLDKMPLFEWSGSTRQMLNNGYVFTIVAEDELLVLG